MGMMSGRSPRSIVERHLDEQAIVLSSVRMLIEDRVPLGEWPAEASSFEHMKARNLAKHLFRRDVPAQNRLQIYGDRPELADRVRADLAGLVRLGAGRYLVAELVEVEAPTRPAM